MVDMLDTRDVARFVNSRAFFDRYYNYLISKKHIGGLEIDKSERNTPLDSSYIKNNIDKLEFKTSYLANGEYNCNYRIEVIYEGRKIDDMVFRINYASQMNLKNQIAYEFMGLEAVCKSGVTPVPYFYDDSKKDFPRDYLVMAFIQGRPMDYKKDLLRAAKCLSMIHKTCMPEDNSLVEPDNPFKAILEESTNMYSKYRSSDLFDHRVDERVQKIFARVQQICDRLDISYDGQNSTDKEGNKSIINTELNSSNFIIGDRTYLIDWEKPIIGEKEQDLGHFLAPTTSFWKTDIIFTRNQVEEFLKYYFGEFYGIEDQGLKLDQFESLRDKVYSYIRMNCLRGVTWCAMAWVEYNKSEKDLLNEFTFNKLKAYLDLDYLDMLVRDFIED